MLGDHCESCPCMIGDNCEGECINLDVDVTVDDIENDIEDD